MHHRPSIHIIFSPKKTLRLKSTAPFLLLTTHGATSVAQADHLTLLSTAPSFWPSSLSISHIGLVSLFSPRLSLPFDLIFFISEFFIIPFLDLSRSSSCHSLPFLFSLSLSYMFFVFGLGS